MIEASSPKQLESNAKSAYQREEYKEAGAIYEAAARAYKVREDELTSAEMLNNACVAYLQTNSPEDALRCVRDTPSIFESAGDQKRLGLALGNLGTAFDELGHVEEAAEAYIRSATVLQEIGETDMRLHVLKSLSSLQMRSGKQIQALITMQTGLEDIEKPSLKQRALKRILRLPFDYLNRG
jgi:tetratricopeptide (TPR) repeat protein